jgi:hypothetical protein
MWRNTVVAVIFLTLTVIASGESSTPCASSRAASREVLALFDQHRLVMLGEQHRRKEFYDFLHAVVNEPDFPIRVNDIVIEAGNSRFQPILDRYIRGDNVPITELRKIWQDTTMVAVWDSPLYRDFLASVRELNARLPVARRLRVLAGDPPIDWASVKNKDDFQRFADRDLSYATVVEREVLTKGRRALLIVGGIHVIRRASTETEGKHPGVADLLNVRHPGLAYSVYTLERPLNEITSCYPSLTIVSGTVGSLSFGKLVPKSVRIQRIVNGKPEWVEPKEEDWPVIREKLDALLDLGPTMTEIPETPDVLPDKKYLVELHRRAKILTDFFGFDLESDLPPIPK